MLRGPTASPPTAGSAHRNEPPREDVHLALLMGLIETCEYDPAEAIEEAVEQHDCDRVTCEILVETHWT